MDQRFLHDHDRGTAAPGPLDDGVEQNPGARLREHEGMEAAARTAGRIAHDVNNLLSVILTYAEFLDASIADATARDDLEQIVQAARRGAQLTSKLLAFSRRQGSETASADVNLAVTTAAASFGLELGEGVTFETRLGADLPHACCDRTELELALVQLALNAREAMPDGGRLTLTTALRSVDQDAALGGQTSGPARQVTVSVHDTGCGLDAEIRPRIFEPFVTTKPKGLGTGLGLSIVYGTAVRFGGHVEVSSGPGRGTTFTVVLPVAEGIP